VPIRLAIVGPPKSGKSTLARRFAAEYGVMRLSIGEAMRTVLCTQPNTELALCIRAYLVEGQTVPDELAVQALEVVLMDVKCRTRGYILDGYPVTKSQVVLMEQRNIIPVKIIELEIDGRDCADRATSDRYSKDRILPLHDSAQIFVVKMAAFHNAVGAIRDWYEKEHDNWIRIPADRSRWWVWNAALDIASKLVIQIQTYLQRIAEGKAASIADMCISPDEFTRRLGAFGQYCPVNLADKNELVDCSLNPKLTFAAEFKGLYYKMEGQSELGKFLDNPDKYVTMASRPLPTPENLPKRRSAAEAKQLFPMPIELRGYCPVTFLDGKCRYEAIVPGDPELVVEYQGKLYYMETEQKLQKFMRSPHLYCNLKLPHKLPPKHDPLVVNSLPMLGYMEQTVALAITKALTAVGMAKPKYPFINTTKSALIYVAFHLKAFNPNSPLYVRKKYKRKLEQFEEMCELIQYLGKNMSKRYKEPQDRPIDFDFKLGRFMELQNQPLTASIRAG
jgi:adenylate/nucleoside-diphosphate kinase